jgi:hypothetical protein
MRIASIDKTGTYYNVSDHLGSASLVLDASGAVVQKLDYLPYGAERLNEKESAVATALLFVDKLTMHRVLNLIK